MEEEYFAAHASERTIREWSTLLTRSIGAISKKTSRMGITCKNNNTVNESQPEPLENRMVMGIDPEKVISYLRQKPHTATELADVLDRGPQTVMEIVAQMQKLGYCVVAKQQRIMTSPPGPIQQAPIVTLQDQPYDEIAFLLISDLHYSNQHAQVTAVHRIVDLAIKEYGINFAFIAGDICDGINMYKGQANEQYAIGADAQVWAAINHLPNRPGFRYFLLGGNHDGSFYKAAGLDICRLVGAARHDVDYLGAFAVDVPITEALSIRLWHPSGGCPYALSYRGQKAVASMGAQELIELMASTDRWYDQLDALGESLERGDVVSSFKETVGRSMSRRILGIGHLHVMTHFATGGIHVFQAGCFEGQTSYLKQKQLTPEIGGWIIRVQFTRSGQIKRLMAEWIPFEERFDDHRAYPLPPMPGEANALEPIFSYEGEAG